ncbi:MAG: hypothetical protein AAB263_02055 [Planctomycetota bacterium]
MHIRNSVINAVLLNMLLHCVGSAVDFKIGDEVNYFKVQTIFELNNGEKPRAYDRYSVTMVVDDLNGDGLNDLIIEDKLARGATGNRSFSVFVSSKGSDQLKYLGDIGSLVRVIKYENGHNYIIESWNPGGGEYFVSMSLVSDGKLTAAGGKKFVASDDAKIVESNEKNLKLIREYNISEERLLQLMGK